MLLYNSTLALVASTIAWLSARRDSASLLTAKKLLSSSNIVSATIDFEVIPGIHNYLSDSMLRLAYLIKPNTFFGALNADDHGNIEYRTYRVNFSTSIEETKQDENESLIIKPEKTPENIFKEKMQSQEANEMIGQAINEEKNVLKANLIFCCVIIYQ
jgi:hypothetical protein